MTRKLGTKQLRGVTTDISVQVSKISLGIDIDVDYADEPEGESFDGGILTVTRNGVVWSFWRRHHYPLYRNLKRTDIPKFRKIVDNAIKRELKKVK